ncbi:MAG: glucosaminidase [Bacteroidetes bacterium 4572_77]|nr:MAG: glucosaminidase [Bacteroidetes bacterium 4572_77]
MRRDKWLFLFLLITFRLVASEPFMPNKLQFTAQNYYSVFIMDKGKCSAQELASMLLFYNPSINQHKAAKIAQIYIEESQIEGVNSDIAFCQMALETGFLNYGGDVDKKQNNFCGLGATGNAEPGLHFPDVRTGVMAHIQHLKAYGSKENIRKPSVDIRFKYVKRGSATSIYKLSGKWASDPLYDQKLENLLIRLFRHKSFLAFGKR